MLDIDKKQFIKRYQALDRPLQDIIFSDQTSDAIRKTCVLREAEQYITAIAKFVGFILLGYLRPELFALEIQKETGIDMEKAQLVARDLDTEIFSAVRLELKKLYPPTIQTPTVQSWMGQKDLQPDSQPKPRYVIPIPEKFLRQNTDVAQKSNVARPDLQQPINQLTRITDSKTNSVDGNLKSAGEGQVSEKQANQSGEVRPPTTNGLPQPQTQKATNSVVMGGIQRAETKPQAGGGQVSQIAKEVTKSQGAESRPQEQAGTKPQLQPTTYNLQPNQQPSFKPIVPLPTFIQTQFKKQEPRSANETGDRPGSQLSDDPQIKDFMGKFTTSSTQKPKPPAENPYREKV